MREFLLSESRRIVRAGGYVHPELRVDIVGDQLIVEGDIRPGEVSLVIPWDMGDRPREDSYHRTISDRFGHDWHKYKATRMISDRLWPLAMYFNHSAAAEDISTHDGFLILRGNRACYTKNTRHLREVYGIWEG